ncbi:MAG TPA: hypothetical protein VLH16_02830 [Bacteroidales bacterium]|nr:hypothetical protein [Bacteroidales bacterium]
MIKKIVIFVFLFLVILIGAAYFFLWPWAQQLLANMTAVVQPALETVAEPTQVLPPEGVTGVGEMLALLPILQKIGMDTLTQIQDLAAGGVTMEEAQQALDILREQLSAEELAQLLAVLNPQL